MRQNIFGDIASFFKPNIIFADKCRSSVAMQEQNVYKHQYSTSFYVFYCTNGTTGEALMLF